MLQSTRDTWQQISFHSWSKRHIKLLREMCVSLNAKQEGSQCQSSSISLLEVKQVASSRVLWSFQTWMPRQTPHKRTNISPQQPLTFLIRMSTRSGTTIRFLCSREFWSLESSSHWFVEESTTSQTNISAMRASMIGSSSYKSLLSSERSRLRRGKFQMMSSASVKTSAPHSWMDHNTWKCTISWSKLRRSEKVSGRRTHWRNWLKSTDNWWIFKSGRTKEMATSGTVLLSVGSCSLPSCITSLPCSIIFSSQLRMLVSWRLLLSGMISLTQSFQFRMLSLTTWCSLLGISITEVQGSSQSGVNRTLPLQRTITIWH